MHPNVGETFINTWVLVYIILNSSNVILELRRKRVTHFWAHYESIEREKC